MTKSEPARDYLASQAQSARGDASTGCPETNFSFGLISLQAATDPETIAEALRWIETAADEGHQGAEHLLQRIAGR